MVCNKKKDKTILIFCSHNKILLLFLLE